MRSRASLVVLATLFALRLTSATAAADPSFEAWSGRDDAILLVIVADGLRPDYMQGTRPDGSPLMPRLSLRHERAIRFENCESRNTAPIGGSYEILTGANFAQFRAARRRPTETARTGLLALSEAGFSTHAVVLPHDLRASDFLGALAPEVFPASSRRRARPVAGRMPSQRPDSNAAATLQRAKSLIDEAAAAGGRHLIVVFADELLPPFDLQRSLVDSLDATPWIAAPEELTIEEHRRARRERAAQIGAMSDAAWLQEYEGLTAADRRRAVEAAHANMDAWLGELLRHAESAIAGARLCVALTASSATALGERGMWGSGAGVQHDTVRVPLWIWAGGQGARIDAPVTPADFAYTVAKAFGVATAENAANLDLFDGIAADRLRPHVGYAAFGSAGVMRSVGEASFCDGTLRYILSSEHGPLLFDLQNDPESQVDLHALQPALTQACQDHLAALLGTSQFREWSAERREEFYEWLNSTN
jgi:hypothetical protein